MRCRAAVVPAVLAPLLMTGCGGGGESADTRPVGAASGAAVSAGYNDDDVMFLQMMVAHHEQGLEMVQVAAERAQRKEVRTLAAAVEATQSEEVKLMTSWLDKWSKPKTADSSEAAHHLYHGASPGTGAKEIDALKRMKGARFEPAFLNLFIAHQHNAVKMAQLETDKGVNPDAKAFAKRVQESRSGQIQQMLGMLNG